jgi:hypothetical protein
MTPGGRFALCGNRLLSPCIHSRSLRSPGRLARLAWRPRAVGRLRAVDDGDNRAKFAAATTGGP